MWLLSLIGWKVWVGIAAWNIAVLAILAWLRGAVSRPSICPKCDKPETGDTRDGSGLCWCSPEE
jgi:hypothetical protein